MSPSDDPASSVRYASLTSFFVAFSSVCRLLCGKCRALDLSEVGAVFALTLDALALVVSGSELIRQ